MTRQRQLNDFFLFLVNFRVLLSFVTVREKKHADSENGRQRWDIITEKFVQGKFAKQILCKVKPGKKFQDYFLYYSRPKKKMYELVFSERYMLLWVKWEIPVPLILFRWLVLHWWWATCNESTCLFTGSREGNDNWRIRNLKRRIGNEWVQKEKV